MKKIIFLILYFFLIKNLYCEISANIEGAEINFYNGTTKVAIWKLLSSGIFKYEGELINGDIKVFSGEKDNVISSVYKIKNNIIQDNIYEWFYKTGEKAGEEIFKSGKLNGEFKWYYKNGKVSRTGNYKDGKKHGEFKWFFESGNMAQEGKYNTGLKCGVFKIYYENGQLKELITFVNNKRNGLYQQFYDTGTIKVEGNFKNNLKDGEFILFFESGEQAGKKVYKNGELISEEESTDEGIDDFDLSGPGTGADL